jgi:hypothetical protein
VVVAYGIKAPLIQSRVVVAAAAEAQIKTQIDLEYGVDKVLMDRDSQAVRDYDTIEKAIMLTHRVVAAVQVALVFTVWIVIMMEFVQTVDQVLLVTS